jgi:hypothetical protein
VGGGLIILLAIGLGSAAISKESSRRRTAVWLGNEVLKGQSIFIEAHAQSTINAFQSQGIPFSLLAGPTTPRPAGTFLVTVGEPQLFFPFLVRVSWSYGDGYVNGEGGRAYYWALFGFVCDFFRERLWIS